MKKIINPLLIVFMGAILRIIPHVPNVTPITAIALFGGVYLGKRYAILLPLLVLVLSDYLLLYINPFSSSLFNFSRIYAPQALFTNTTIAVYGSFFISSLVGLWLRKHKSPFTITFAAIFCAVQFFMITNAAVWVAGAYSRSIVGLWESYVAGIPFFRGTLFGDLVYTFAFFGGYALMQKFTQVKKGSIVT